MESSAAMPEVIRIEPPDPAGAGEFGEAMAVGESGLVVGAPAGEAIDGPENTGVVYLIDAATGEHFREMTAEDGASGDQLGASVAAHGNWVVAGAPGADHENAPEGGAVYVFDAGTGEQVRKLAAPEPGWGDYYGASVALSGEALVVGAPNRELGSTKGSVFVYDPMTFDERFTLEPEERMLGANFGSAVALAGNYAVIGAPGESQVYVYDAVTGEFIRKMGNEAGGRFGWSVSAFGDLAVAGAPTESSSGAAYLFNFKTGEQLGRFVSSMGRLGRFGESTAIGEMGVAVGAPQEEGGRVYFYNPVTGVELGSFTPPAGGRSLGTSLALDGNIIFTGAPGDSIAGSSAGAVYYLDTAGVKSLDFGDAPASYGTLLADDGARHVLGSGLHLGETADAEGDGFSPPAADEMDNQPDEDGVADERQLQGENLTTGQMAVLTVSASAAGKLDAWMDWNGDGMFGEEERIAASMEMQAGSNELEFIVPQTLVTQSWLRLRLSSAGGLGPLGEAADGEVEDYPVAIRVERDRSVVVSAAADGPGTLRDALNWANSNPPAAGEMNSITFNIPGDGPFLIPGREFEIWNPLILDGFSQPGSIPNSNPVEERDNAFRSIRIEGDFLLLEGAGGTLIRGIEVNGTVETHRLARNIEGVGIEGCLIAGSVSLRGNTHRVGGVAPEQRNVLQGGLVLSGEGCQIKNNLVGLEANGRIPAGAEEAVGILVRGSNHVIGGEESQARNIIAGFSEAGIKIESLLGSDSTGNAVVGNRIGTDITGTFALGNGYGIYLRGADGNEIASNVISGNEQAGIYASESSQNAIEENIIGADPEKKIAVRNGSGGIVLINSSENFLSGNLVCATISIFVPVFDPDTGEPTGETALWDGHGITLSGAGSVGNRVQGNVIGEPAGAEEFMGNHGAGVRIIGGAAGNIIGEEFPEAGEGAQPGFPPFPFGNDFRRNLGGGVVVVKGASGGLPGNQVKLNSFHETGIPIDVVLEIAVPPFLEGAGESQPNDEPDNDGVQNFPEVVEAVLEGETLRAVLRVTGPVSTVVEVDLMARTGLGEVVPIGSTHVTTDANGTATVEMEVSAEDVPPGTASLTASGTTINEGTGEFDPFGFFFESAGAPDITLLLRNDRGSLEIPSGTDLLLNDSFEPTLGKEFLIRNEGTENLRLAGSPPVLVGLTPIRGTNWVYEIVQPETTLLRPGEETSFWVRVHEADAGLLSGKITIESNDPDEDPHELSITILGLPFDMPILQVLYAGKQLYTAMMPSFETGTILKAAPDEEVVHTFILRNGGGEDLVIGSVEFMEQDPAWSFGTKPAAGTVLEPGGLALLDIKFNPIQGGNDPGSASYANQVVIESNDPAARFLFPVEGRVPKLDIEKDSSTGIIKLDWPPGQDLYSSENVEGPFEPVEGEPPLEITPAEPRQFFKAE